jgi:hypothetical protein
MSYFIVLIRNQNCFNDVRFNLEMGHMSEGRPPIFKSCLLERHARIPPPSITDLQLYLNYSFTLRFTF